MQEFSSEFFNEFSNELSNEYWYEKVVDMLPWIDIQWSSRENWKQVYDIISSQNPSRLHPISLSEGYNVTALRILDKLGYDINTPLVRVQSQARLRQQSDVTERPRSLVLDRKWNRDAFEGVLTLTGPEMSEVLLYELKKDRTSFEKHHFHMLLQELILEPTEVSKSRDALRSANGMKMSHYVAWISQQISHKEVTPSTRRLFIYAAQQALDNGVLVPESQLQVAYIAFFLLAYDQDTWTILKRLRNTPGVTQEGLHLSAMLLGAALGKLRVQSTHESA